MRPSQYAFLDQLMKDADGRYVYSLRKAEEYKRASSAGSLRIQKLSDARAHPPRGFTRLSPESHDHRIEGKPPCR